MKLILKTTLLSLTIILLSACGGGSKKSTTSDGGSTGGGSTGGSSSGGSGGTTGSDNIANTCSDSLSTNGKTVTYQSGSKGDIDFDCKFPSKNKPTGQEFSLKNGIASLNVKNVQRTTDLDYSCNNGTSFKGTSTTSYKTGKVNYSGTLNGSAISCTETYTPVALPTTISGHDSIESLLDNDFDSNDPTQSSCPNDIDDTDFQKSVCRGFFNTQYNITDDSDKVHKLSVDISFE